MCAKNRRKERKWGRDKKETRASTAVKKKEKKKWAAVAKVIYRLPQTKIPLSTFVGQALLKLKRKKITYFRVFASPPLSILSPDCLRAAISLGKMLGIMRKALSQKGGIRFLRAGLVNQVLIRVQ